MTGRDADERLKAQLAYLRSDDRLRERAGRAQELSTQERVELTYRLSEEAMAMLDGLPAEVRARVEVYREPLGPGAERVLRRLGGLLASTDATARPCPALLGPP